MSSWADDVLACAPLRDAVYRNRTPDRGLRHAVSLGCLPFRSFAAVAPWLPPWDIVSPAEACAKVTSLHMNIGTARASRRSIDELTRVGNVLTEAVRDSQAFRRVRSLNMNLTGVGSLYSGNCVALFYALQRILRCFPALESFVVDGLPRNGLAQRVWLNGDSDLPLFTDDEGTPACGSAAVEAFWKMPRLRSVDIRRVEMYHATDLFFTSLLLCRGALKTLSCGSCSVVPALVGTSREAAPDFRIRHASETPPCPEPESIELTVSQRVPASVVPRVPVHWTLETLVVDPCEVPPQYALMQQLVLMCPRLQAVTLRGTRKNFDCARHTWARVGIALASADLSEATASGESTVVTSADARFLAVNSSSATKEMQLAAMHVAHRYVQAVVSAYAADRSLLPEALSRHRAGLDAVVDGGAYPAALLWAFARGPEHTTLRSLCLPDVTVSGEDAASAAVVALAVWQRKRH